MLYITEKELKSTSNEDGVTNLEGYILFKVENKGEEVKAYALEVEEYGKLKKLAEKETKKARGQKGEKIVYEFAVGN